MIILNRIYSKLVKTTVQRYIHAQRLVYGEYGEPAKVVKLEEMELPEPKGNEVVVEMLAAPVNPADINTIQGVYPAKPPSLPAVGGKEGVGKILEVGPEVSTFKEGDYVVPNVGLTGTWSTHIVCDAKELWQVPSELGIVEAATITVNPCTAYRMLKDFVPLSPGDTIIQNGANSAAGQNVIQLCRIWGINSVNIVRDRPNIDELKKFLTGLGATHVLTEEELGKSNIFKTGAVARPKLALNCVGGKSALQLLRNLEHSGAMVTYGGMSREPVTLPTSSLIFKNVSAHGYWMTTWSQRNQGTPQAERMKQDIIRLMVERKLKAPVHKLVPLEDYKTVLESCLNVQGFTGMKYLFDFRCDR